jgi:hypothetical protein
MHVEREALDGIVDGLKFHGWRANGASGCCIAAEGHPDELHVLLYGIG